ncbi:hypothetical protein B1C78_15760 [Thioalkalivibrio denitrificans]|uniref:Uncharacterized protein n=1 Tax=Thioalkalivibrio denitrificans TaxID=108003 RepID=A0A1V3NAW1_9GAMM|nr:hypothetical protein [Thioalkalivibrio denitrificans]OOG21972.1 hypothetical protein B1C78_15760 [Thioalkalivibrio denitrificans]
MGVLKGVAAGAAVISAIVTLCLVPLFLLLGPERVLVDNSMEAGAIWIWMAMVVCLTAASLGGWITHRVSGSIGAVVGLLAVVVLAGLLDAGYHQWLSPADAIVRAQASWIGLLVGMREPLWYDLALPVLMGIFVWVAGSGRAMEHRPSPGRHR